MTSLRQSHALSVHMPRVRNADFLDALPLLSPDLAVKNGEVIFRDS